MPHVGGQLQALFMARVRGLDPQRCLVVPVDVGKSMAMALVADHYGEVVVEPFEFALNEAGFAMLAAAIARSESVRSAEVVRVGVESAGHYHRTLRGGEGKVENIDQILAYNAIGNSVSMVLILRTYGTLRRAARLRRGMCSAPAPRSRHTSPLSSYVMCPIEH
jgi:hypothetical protein